MDLDQTKHPKEIELQERSNASEIESLTDGASINSKDCCWICYDSERQDAGPLIQPCQCRGDVSAVHHNCLRRWLVEVTIICFFFFPPMTRRFFFCSERGRCSCVLWLKLEMLRWFALYEKSSFYSVFLINSDIMICRIDTFSIRNIISRTNLNTYNSFFHVTSRFYISFTFIYYLALQSIPMNADHHFSGVSELEKFGCSHVQSVRFAIQRQALNQIRLAKWFDVAALAANDRHRRDDVWLVSCRMDNYSIGWRFVHKNVGCWHNTLGHIRLHKVCIALLTSLNLIGMLSFILSIKLTIFTWCRSCSVY